MHNETKLFDYKDNLPKYISPEVAREEGGESFHHAIELKINGTEVGGADLRYLSKPLPHYALESLWVEPGMQGRGYGTLIMDKVESWLRERGRPGVLVNAILDNEPAAGMYQRRGWTPCPDNPHRLVFNWPDKIDINILKGYHYRYTNLSERNIN